MSPGPLRRAFGALGLLALAPTAWMLARGLIAPAEAALRAAATLVVVLVLSRLTGWWLGALAGSFERGTGDDGEAASGAAGGAQGEAQSPAIPRRRAEDPPTPDA